MMIGSLFSGIGGLELGAEMAGLAPVRWQVEQSAFCREVLARHWPNARRDVTDVRFATGKNLEPVDAIIGGFPCQDVSSAGKGAGLAGERSGLWYEFARIVGELRPTVAIVENVASAAARWLPHVRHGLHVLGYRTRAIKLSAFDVGAPHLRSRVFVIASDPERFPLWLESRGRTGPHGGGSSELAHDGSEGTLTHAHGERELQSGGRVWAGWRWSRDGRGWCIEPPVPGVAYGISDRLDLERAYGNAVVPQCAASAIRYALETPWPP